MKRIEIETLLEYRFLSAPSFSPEGNEAAFLASQASLAENGYTHNLWVYDLASRSLRQLTHDGRVGSYTYDRQGRLMVCRRAPGGTTLSRLTPKEGREEAVATLPVKVLQLAPLADGRFAVLAEYRIPGKAAEPGAPYHVFEELPFWWNAQGFVNGVRRRLYLWNPALPTEAGFTPVTGEDFTVGNLSTSPWRLSAEGDWLLFLGQGMADGVQKQHPGLYGWRISTGELRQYIPEGTQRVEAAQILPNTSRAIFTATDGGEYGACQMPEFHTLDLPSGEIAPLCRYELSIGAAITTDAALGGGITNKGWGDSLYFITMDGASSYLRRIDGEGRLSDYLTPPGSCAAFDVCPGHLLYLGMYGNGLRELYLDGEQITHFGDGILAEYQLSTPVPLTSRREGGEEVQGWVMPPVGYQPGQRYPAILNIHGGPRAAFGPTYFHEMQVWAGAGYFVFYCNPHGSDGRGNAFGDLRGAYGTIDYEDLMAFTDAVLGAWPDIDPGRVGVTGGSYGGYMTNWIIGHTRRFRCAASQRSIADWALSEFVSDCGYQRNAAKMGATAHEDHEKVWWHSPLKYAPDVTTPTLFLHSFEDYRCYHTQAVAMYTAIRQRGVPSRLVLFRGENHELSRSGAPENRIARMREILSWMDRYLKQV